MGSGVEAARISSVPYETLWCAWEVWSRIGGSGPRERFCMPCSGAHATLVCPLSTGVTRGALGMIERFMLSDHLTCSEATKAAGSLMICIVAYKYPGLLPTTS